MPMPCPPCPATLCHALPCPAMPCTCTCDIARPRHIIPATIALPLCLCLHQRPLLDRPAQPFRRYDVSSAPQLPPAPLVSYKPNQPKPARQGARIEAWKKPSFFFLSFFPSCFLSSNRPASNCSHACCTVSSPAPDKLLHPDPLPRPGCPFNRYVDPLGLCSPMYMYTYVYMSLSPC